MGLKAFILTLFGIGKRRISPFAYAPTHRSKLPISIAGDWRSEKARYDRPRLVAASRFFEQRNGLAVRLGQVFCDFVVGPSGLVATPATPDPLWNSAARIYWDRTQRDLVIGHQAVANFRVAQGLLAWRWFFDGEVFILLTQDDSGAPKIQIIESHAVQNPPNAPRLGRNLQLVDGVIVDRLGIPRAYYVAEYDATGKPASWARYDASQIIHLLDPASTSEIRGSPMLAPVLADLHALMDLEEYEIRAAYDAAEKTMIFKLADGEFMDTDLRRSILEGTGPTTNPEDFLRQRLEAYQESVGGRAIALRVGEDTTIVEPKRPTDEQRFFWEYLIGKICAGVGIPKQLVMPYSVQGTVARADFAAARASMAGKTSVFIDVVRKIYTYCIFRGISRGELPGQPAQWNAVNIRPPRQIDVDVGRNSAAMLAELKAGATHFELVYGPMGLDWAEELEKRAQQLAFIRDLAERYGVDPAQITEIAETTQPETAQTDERPLPEELA